MPNYKMAKPGHSFSEGGVDLSWGIGREESDVISLPAAEQSSRFKQRVLAGVIVETKDPPTDTTPISDIREYRLLTGDEARAHKAIPAGPVTRNVFNPVTNELMAIEMAATRPPAKEVVAEPEPEPQAEPEMKMQPEPEPEPVDIDDVPDPAEAELEASE